jgi:hypothetical protein
LAGLGLLIGRGPVGEIQRCPSSSRAPHRRWGTRRLGSRWRRPEHLPIDQPATAKSAAHGAFLMRCLAELAAFTDAQSLR